ncbi:hypothetical protein ACOSP7_015408 [Xanthoceras sorbifolium]
MRSMRLFAVVVIGFMFLEILQLSYGQQVMASSPAPAPSRYGTVIDQGIAYVLLIVALAITYLVH